MQTSSGLNVLAFCVAAAAASSACAGSAVYKQTNEWGDAVYSDRPANASARPIRNRIPPDPGPAGYNAAVNRAESDRLALQRSYAENHQARKVTIYNPPPGYAQQRAAAPGQSMTSYPPSRRWDPNLPASPAPSLERNYYYNGR